MTTNLSVQRSTLRSLGLVTMAGAIGLSLFLTASVSAESTTADAHGAKPTVVLVHGAWADASSWEGVIKRLQDGGYTVIAPANPLRGVTSDSAYIASVLDTIPGPVVLVGHSYGGIVTSNAAALTKNKSIQALVYVAAFIPEAGESALQLVSHTPPGTPGASKLVPPGTPGAIANMTARPFPPFPPFPPIDPTAVDLYLNADTFRANFAADVPEAKTSLMAVTQRPLSLLAFGEPSGAVAWKTIPSWSLVATQDNAIGWANTSFMAQRTVTEGKGHVSEISAAHAAMVAHPEAVEDLIREADRATR